METGTQGLVGYGSLAVIIVIVVGMASTGGIFPPGAWYAGLEKPAWTPPNWLFGPAWTVLYACIAAAGWLIWRETGGQWSTAMTFWALQVVFNAAWSWLFFGERMPLAALGDLVLMLACIVGFILTAWSLQRTAALLFVPYAVWVTFAGALNFAIWRLNEWPAAAQQP